MKKLILCSFMLMVISFTGHTSHFPVIENGFLDLSGWDFIKKGAVRLSGCWKYKYNEEKDGYENPGYDDSNWEELDIPGYWNKKENSPTGFCWLRCKIILPLEAESGLYLKFCNTAYVLYVNGKRLMYNGAAENTCKATIPYRLTQTGILPREREIVIAWKISNFDDPNGGAFHPLLLGDFQQLQRKKSTEDFGNALLLGMILMIGLVNLYYWIVTKINRIALYFCMSCFFIFIRFFITAGFLENIFFYPYMYWIHLKTEYISTFLGVAFFVLYWNSLFNKKINRTMILVIIIAALLFTGFILFSSLMLFTSLLLVFQCVLVFAFIYCIFLAISIYKKDKKAVILGFISILLLFLPAILEIATTVDDMLFAETGIGYVNFLIIGCFIFLFFQPVVFYSYKKKDKKNNG